MRRARETHEAEKRSKECWRAGRLKFEIRWSGKASLEKVTFEQTLEGSTSQYSEGTGFYWTAGMKRIPERKIKVKTLKSSWRNMSKDR